MSQQLLQDFVYDNLEFLKERTTSYKNRFSSLLESEESVFHSDINKQYRITIQEIVAEELSKSTNLDIETCLIFVEENLGLFV